MKSKFFLIAAVFLIFTVSLTAHPSYTNLLKNPQFENAFNDWDISNGGDGWIIGGGGDINTSHVAFSSYDWCTLSQEIDLLAAGFSVTDLDVTMFDVFYSQWFIAPWGGKYYIEVKALNSAHELLYQSNIGSMLDPIILGNTSNWQQTSLIFSVTQPGVRYISYIVAGMDVLFWAGYYGTRFDDASVQLMMSTTDVSDSNIPMPIKHTLKVYPNPFNPASQLLTGTYGLSKAENATVSVYNVKGQKMQTLETGSKNPGVYPITWDGNDANGRMCRTGIYFLSLQTSDFRTSVKIALIK